MAQEMLLKVLILSVLLRVSEAYIQCGEWNCYGNAYCCTYDPGQCCFYVWSLWWFWCLWILLFTFCASCGYCCYRRRRLAPDYVIIQQPQQPVYGTVVPSTGYEAGVAATPQKPPEYMQKPPPYNQQHQPAGAYNPA
ncbi:unnamed protein product [Owenia fusiformis]|uniref:Uncharacterized protein n=1 Tax=Owenia fusiformis TaxID=6347 RepID=A0A8J1Y7Y8_OWEFU|nr:unnamed protein product [Owenia fusiformis]